jgi:hypothetical protein
MSDVAKRQRTVPIQDGYGADHIPEFGRDSDVFSFTGPTHRPMFPLINYQGANKYWRRICLTDGLSDPLLI